MIINLTGQRFGRLQVVRLLTERKHSEAVWECVCECGNIKHIQSYCLRSGQSKSCGCLNRELTSKANTTHGKTNSLAYKSWEGMMQRCYNPKNNAYRLYGGKGIKVCPLWRDSFEAFYKDMGERPIGLTIERIDSTEDYTPENCKWATYTEQGRNTSRVKLSVEKVTEIRVLSATGLSGGKISRLFGVNASTINNVLAGKTWKGVG